MSVKQGLQLLLSASASVWLQCLPLACALQHFTVVPSTERVRLLGNTYLSEKALVFPRSHSSMSAAAVTILKVEPGS